MSGTYYNEIDPGAAAWLRELIRAGAIPDGEVDTRSIALVAPEDVRGFHHQHYFAGIGGWAYALQLAGWPADRPVWTGSCPCQPFSSAGAGKGASDPRHLWPEWARLIKECRPPVVFGEQVEAAIAHGWIDLVQADLEGEGYAFGWAGLPAAGVGAPHIRGRVWFVADTGYAERGSGDLARDVEGWDALRRGGEGGLALPDQPLPGDRELQRSGGLVQPPADTPAGFWDAVQWLPCRDHKSRPVEPGTFPLAHGVPARVGRLRGYGNAIVPQVAEAFIRAYLDATEA